MYSAVLMVALATSAQTVDHCGRSYCGGYGYCGGYSTCGYTSYGCTGYSGCSSYYGCQTSYGGHGGLFRRHGCQSSYCSSYGYGGSYGCSSSYGCSGYVCSGYGGSYGCSGYVCSGYVCGSTMVPPVMMPPAGEPIPMPGKKSAQLAPATIQVTLPVNARLSVDGSLTTSTSAQRTLVTPELQIGETYVYTLRAEVDNNVQTQQVTVRGGQTSTVPVQLLNARRRKPITRKVSELDDLLPGVVGSPLRDFGKG